MSESNGTPRLVGAGVYTPRYRITAAEIADAWGRFQGSGIREKAVAATDEDALTMGTAAAREALDAADVDAEAVESLVFASTTPPIAEEDLTPRLGAFLGLGDDAANRTLSGSTRTGTQALLVAADTERFPALVVAADCPRGEPNSSEEHAAGAGAAAFILDTAEDGAELVARGEYAATYPGTRFREQGSIETQGLGITSYDRQAFRECVDGAVAAAVDGAGDAAGDDAGDAAADPTALALQAPDGKLPGRATRALDTDADLVTVASDLGDLGAASAPAALARAIGEGHESVLAVGYGSGAGADALHFEGTAPVRSNERRETESVDYAHYLRLRGELTGDGPAGGGAQVSVPSWRRNRAARYRLEAGRCPECGAIAFPASGACPDCHELVAYDPVRLARTGTVETATGVSPGGAPPEFAVQAAKGGDFGVAIVTFPAADGDGAASIPVQVTDGDGAGVEAGTEVRAVTRRIYTQEAVTRYGTKVVRT